MSHTAGVSKEVSAVLYLHLIFMVWVLSPVLHLLGHRTDGFGWFYSLWFFNMAMENHCF